MSGRHLTTRSEWEDALRDGRKMIDARVVADDIAGVEVGQIVRYPGAHARVRHVRFYHSFGDLLAHEEWRQIAPEASSAEEVLHLLRDGHAETERDRGVVAIELEPIGEQP